MNQPIPPKPADWRNPTAWILWCNEHFPFGEDWQKWLNSRAESERPRFGTYESLEDLKGIEDRGQAAMCAWLWWAILESQDRILGEHKSRQDNALATERQRLIRLACEALDGKLGRNRAEQDAARSTAQNYLGFDPNRATNHQLGDWKRMHDYAKELQRNPSAKKPRLHADIERERQQRTQLADVERAIDAQPAGKPRQMELVR